MDIEKEIENLKVQANHNLLTGYEELAEKQNQYAEWFEELVELREIYKNTLDVVCGKHLECEQCDAYDGDLQRCVLKRKEER